MDKLEDLLQALLKNGLKDFSKEVSIVQNKFTVYG